MMVWSTFRKFEQVNQKYESGGFRRLKLEIKIACSNVALGGEVEVCSIEEQDSV